MQNKQKLELTWIGKNNPEYDIANIEPRILEENKKYSFGQRDSENLIIHGDNLLSLKALLPDFEGKIKCVYIDPPYNTRSAFQHYDDSVEHSTWLSLMRPRLELIRMLLDSSVGSLWISVDDNEVHYLKVLCDEIFGRDNFVANVIWQKRTSPDMRATLGAGHDHILVFATNISQFKNVIKPIPKTDDQKENYKNPDNDPRGPWVSSDFTAQGFRPNQMYKIQTPSGRVIAPPEGRCWKNVEQVYIKLKSEGRMWFGTKGDGVPRRKTYLSESEGQTAWTWWPNSEVGHNQEAKKEIITLFGAGDVFDTPKPERLIHRIVYLATSPGDWVLDSFAGSGTTGSVAHKMGRKWIMVELGDHAYSHVQKRLKKVVEGKDGLKLSEELAWKGGGGFKFYELAPSFIAIDEFGNAVIDGYFNDTKLIRAMCKLTGYVFSPSQKEYWKHGKGQGNDHLYVTTQMLSVAMVQQIARHLGRSETLLICPKKYEPGCEKVDSRITIKKIPQSILKACQFGKKEYLLPIKERAIEEIEDEGMDDDE